MVNEWQSAEHALGYLKIADTIPLQKIVDFRLLEEIRREMLK